MKPRTQEEIDHVRLAFNSNGRPGLIQTIVTEELAKNSTEVEKQELISRFMKYECAHVAALVEMACDMGLEEIGSSCIDLLGVAQGPFSFENAMSLQEIRIGSRRNHITAFLWLSALSGGFERLSPEQQKIFDEICKDFVRLNSAPLEVVSLDDDE